MFTCALRFIAVPRFGADQFPTGSRFRGVAAKVAVALCVAFIAAGTSARAESIVFNVNLAVGNGSVTGTITTDGTLGTIGASDISGLDLTINGPFGSAVATTLSDLYAVPGTDLSETASELIFDFSGTSGGGFHIFSDDSSQVWIAGEGSYVPSICGSECDPNGTPGVEIDSRRYPVYYTELTGAVAIGTSGTAAPEPGAIVLFSIGLIGMGAVRTRRSR